MEHFNCGERVRALQDKLSVTSVELAKRVGVTPQQLARWRHTSNLKLHTVQKVCSALGIGLHVFFEEDDKKAP
jgi:transcriptional regulator with XRE-family HTH domain